MTESVGHVVVVGGGTAGWLSAAMIAAHHNGHRPDGLKVTLVESSDIPTVGVGEGTWPTMKNTLQKIGIDEKTFFARCHSTFKQGGKFIGWHTGNGDAYYHPFTVPIAYERLDLAPYINDLTHFAPETNFQHHICEAGLGPRALTDPDFQGPCNYAYHLDAGEFAELLKQHATDELGVHHLVDTVSNVSLSSDGFIDAITLEQTGKLEGDFFVDCTGFASRLLGQALGVPFKPMDSILFNDRAIAVQAPYPDERSPIPCHTLATAKAAGWIWDIGLTHRRGTGHVFSSDFISEDEAEFTLRQHLDLSESKADSRVIKFSSGHRACWWKKNCVAVGMSAGFVEPLEATAIMLVELSARFISENLPADRHTMAIMEKRFNQAMAYRWQRIIDFLKLHYMLNDRPESYWKAHRDPASIPDSLKEDLAVWATRGPQTADFDSALELFPAASYQYVLYGMGFRPDFSSQAWLYDQQRLAQQVFTRNQQLTRQLLDSLPSHRDLIDRWLGQAA
ncbi:tryptophan halogenase family protein [Marinimicrobium sp. UBA4509]|jgi:flavin-dependent dehydrogenase|uniref:tryptophan halogenase family protein n=2 Tax=unclassified Marinimicrobium TaxID=2632100 RepID=UPI002580D0DB|nr:tryptophan halogenase family protein [Marinimicrobium sp. UBA4509]